MKKYKILKNSVTKLIRKENLEFKGLPGWSSGLRRQYFVLDHEERGGGPGFETIKIYGGW